MRIVVFSLLVIFLGKVAPYSNFSSPSATCQISAGQDCYGNDISATPAGTAQACCDDCSAKSGCGAFTWSQYDATGAPNPTCYMKSACGSKTPAPTCSAGVLNNSPTPAPGPTPPPTPQPPTPPTPAPPPCSSPVIEGILDIKYNGEAKQVYVVNAQRGGVSVSGGTIKIQHGPRVYLGKSCDQSMNGDMFWNVNLMGKNLSYTVDLSGVGCGCNAALYLVSMPARNPDGTAIATKCGDYYCDANYVCDTGCPEIDIQEANDHAFQVTPHKCDPNGQSYNNCDGGGCAKKFGNYGPGSRINSGQPFKVQVGFAKNGGGGLDHMLTTFTQGSNTVSLSHYDCGGGYLQSVGQAIAKGMTITISNWGGSGGDMSWLDVPPCNAGTNCNNGVATFSNLVIS